MQYTPRIRNGRKVKRIDLSTGRHSAILLDNIESLGMVEYLFVLVVFENKIKEPCLYVTSEVNERSLVSGNGSHFLGIFKKDGHSNLGASDDWADINKFERAALQLATEYLREGKPEETNSYKKSNKWPQIVGLGILVLVIQKALEPPVYVWLGLVVLIGIYGFIMNFIAKYKGN